MLSPQDRARVVADARKALAALAEEYPVQTLAAGVRSLVERLAGETASRIDLSREYASFVRVAQMTHQLELALAGFDKSRVRSNWEAQSGLIQNDLAALRGRLAALTAEARPEKFEALTAAVRNSDNERLKSEMDELRPLVEACGPARHSFAMRRPSERSEPPPESAPLPARAAEPSSAEPMKPQSTPPPRVAPPAVSQKPASPPANPAAAKPAAAGPRAAAAGLTGGQTRFRIVDRWKWTDRYTIAVCGDGPPRVEDISGSPPATGSAADCVFERALTDEEMSLHNLRPAVRLSRMAALAAAVPGSGPGPRLILSIGASRASIALATDGRVEKEEDVAELSLLALFREYFAMDTARARFLDVNQSREHAIFRDFAGALLAHPGGTFDSAPDLRIAAAPLSRAIAAVDAGAECGELILADWAACDALHQAAVAARDTLGRNSLTLTPLAGEEFCAAFRGAVKLAGEIVKLSAAVNSLLQELKSWGVSADTLSGYEAAGRQFLQRPGDVAAWADFLGRVEHLTETFHRTPTSRDAILEMVGLELIRYEPDTELRRPELSDIRAVPPLPELLPGGTRVFVRETLRSGYRQGERIVRPASVNARLVAPGVASLVEETRRLLGSDAVRFQGLLGSATGSSPDLSQLPALLDRLAGRG